jgi:cyclopropane fatty-acyl-phospholipid synthase-like methyltransferase
LLDELARAGHEHLDAEYVAGYDRKAGFDADAADEVRLLQGLGLDEHSTLVDLGAGTGTLALAAAATCRRVVAVDVSPEMVAAMTKKVAELGVSNVECVQASLVGYEHQGAPADFVYSRNALHHLPDFWKAMALQSIALMLRPGGIFRLRDIVFAFEPQEAERFIRAWLESGSERPDEGWTRAEFEQHLRDENSTFTWLLEPMLERAGFEVDEADYGPRRIYARYVCVKTGGNAPSVARSGN